MKRGFLEHGSADAIIVHDGTSSAMPAEATLLGTTAPVYDPILGWSSSDGLTGFLYDFAQPKTAYSFRFEISRDWLTTLDTSTSNQVLFYSGTTAGAPPHVRRNGASNYLRSGSMLVDKYVKPDILNGFPDLVEIYVSVNSGFVDVYLEGIPIMTAQFPQETTYPWFRWTGSGTAGAKCPYSDPSPTWMRNLSVFDQPLLPAWHSDYKNFCWIGDSFTNQGQYDLNASTTSSSLTARCELVGNVVDHFSDGTNTATGNKGLSRMIPVAQGLLNKNGFWSPRHQFYGRGGGYINGGAGEKKSAYTMVEMLLNSGIVQQGFNAGVDTRGEHGFGCNRPDVIFSVFGANDILGLVDPDLLKAAYLEAIDLAIANGCKRFVMTNTMPAAMDPVYDTAAARAQVDAMNARWAEIANEREQVVLVDAFNKFGGHDNYDPLDFAPEGATATDRHPSTYGQYKIGKWMAEAFLASV